MNVRAPADQKFLRRFLYISLVCIPFAAWSIYDAAVKFPKTKLEPAVAYAALSDLDSTERSKRWQEIAEEKGWPLAKPKSIADARGAIQLNYLFAVVSLGVGVPMLIWYLRTRTTWVETAPNGVTSSWGETFEFKDVISVDKKKWYDKGMARVRYRHNGAERTFTLDDFKYDRAAMGEILKWVESHVPVDAIVNDNPPPPKTKPGEPSEPVQP